MKKSIIRLVSIGAITGTITGLFGGGGGMMLVPMLTHFTDLDDSEVFPASLSTILPICIISLLLSYQPDLITGKTIAAYLPGSAIGGIIAGIWGKKIPTAWLHRILGIIILWGGIRYLC